MRRDQQPLSSCYRGSGLPRPARGWRCVSRINRMIRSACVRSCSTHHAKSSNAAGSNSKLFKRFLERDAALTLFSFQQTLSHHRTLQQVGRFDFGLDLSPQLDRYDHAEGLTVLVRNVLNTVFCQLLRSTPSR